MSRYRNSAERFAGLSWTPLAPKKNSRRKLREPEEFLPYQLVVLSGYFAGELQKLYATYGLSLIEWRTLLPIASNLANTAVDIVHRVHLDEVAVHRAVKLLISRGLLIRKTDELDRRRKPLVATAKGMAIYRRIMPQAQDFERWALAKLPQSDRRVFARAMRTLLDRLDLAGHRRPPSKTVRGRTSIGNGRLRNARDQAANQVYPVR